MDTYLRLSTLRFVPWALRTAPLKYTPRGTPSPFLEDVVRRRGRCLLRIVMLLCPGNGVRMRHDVFLRIVSWSIPTRCWLLRRELRQNVSCGASQATICLYIALMCKSAF